MPRQQLSSASPLPLAAQQLSSVAALLRALFVVGISFVVAELSVEFQVYYCVHNVDGNVVLIVFVFMMQGQGEAQFWLYPSRTRRHAHPVGLRHSPSFQQFGFRVLRESPGKLFSGSLIDQGGFVNSGMRDSGSEIDGLLSKFGTSPSGLVINRKLHGHHLLQGFGSCNCAWNCGGPFWNGVRWHLRGHL